MSMAALAVVLAAPVPAQTIALKASVPFDFVVGGHTMPAGDYAVSTVKNLVVFRVLNAAGDITPTFTITNAVSGPLDSAGASLTFHRYGSDYFLAEIWDGHTGQSRSIWMSGSEKERANRASLNKPEVVMVLAHR